MGKYASSECTVSVFICIKTRELFGFISLPRTPIQTWKHGQGDPPKNPFNSQTFNILQLIDHSFSIMFSSATGAFSAKSKAASLNTNGFFFTVKRSVVFFRAKAQAMAVGNLVSWQYKYVLLKQSWR